MIVFLSKQEIEEAVQKQLLFCKNHSLPMFAPNDGECYYCKKNIYQNYYDQIEDEASYGIKIDEAGKRHITYCRHCSRTFLD